MNCYLVKDLLPNYIDGLVSEATEKDMQEHFRDCHECQLISEQMKEPIAPVTIQTNVKEINFLKKIKTKTIRNIAIVATAIIIVFGVLTWVFAIGMPANSKDVDVNAEIYHNDDVYLNRGWSIHFELTNGKALKPQNEYIYEEDENGNKVRTSCIITLYEVEPSSVLNECDNYTYPYQYNGTRTPSSDFDYTVTVRYKDKEVFYSMRDEGLFDLAQ